MWPHRDLTLHRGGQGRQGEAVSLHSATHHHHHHCHNHYHCHHHPYRGAAVAAGRFGQKTPEVEGGSYLPPSERGGVDGDRPLGGSPHLQCHPQLSFKPTFAKFAVEVT